MKNEEPAPPQRGFLGFVERSGNRLPDPVFIFAILIGILMAISMICAWAGVSAEHPTQKTEDGSPLILTAKSLLSADNIRAFWVEMPKTFTHFHPLGYVLVVMLGAGVAERSGLFASGIKSTMRHAPKKLLTPTVALVAMLSNHAADAGYVVVIPLAAIVFAAAGRHPLAGIAAGFAGVSGGFSANFTPGQLDALLFGVTESAVAAAQLDSGWEMNIAGNWYFIIILLLIYLPVIWYVTDKVIEPRLGKWIPGELHKDSFGDENKPLTDGEKKGLRRAGIAILGVCVLWLAMTFGPGTPLLNEEPAYDLNLLSVADPSEIPSEGTSMVNIASIKGALHIRIFDSKGKKATEKQVSDLVQGQELSELSNLFNSDPLPEPSSLTEDRRQEIVSMAMIASNHKRQAWYVTATPFFKSLVGGFMILFLAAGWAYGAAAGTIKSGDDLVKMMTEAMKDMGYYLVLAFAAAHFVAMFNWSNLGLITAVHGASAIEGSGLPLPVALGLIVLFAALLNLFVGSASAKWALLAPVLVPMLMLLGISPEGATAAYRVGDGATNIITPLMVYFPLILIFAKRWDKDFGIGSLTAMMIPYSVWMLITGVVLIIVWIAMGIPLGPGAPMGIELLEA
ncbi:MAG: AbgT family transporter, partial [Verrucomicrobiota bacterium]